MDGTLLSSESKISLENKKAIIEAQDAGYIVMICSGRSHDHLLTYLEEEGISVPVSGSNGAVTYVDNKIIHEAPMSFEVAGTLFNWLEEKKQPFKIFTNKGTFCQNEFLSRAKEAFVSFDEQETLNRMTLDFFFENQKKQSLVPISNFEEMGTEKDLFVFKYYVYTPDESVKNSTQEWLSSREGISFASSWADNIEIMSTHGNKGTGITQIAEYYHIPLENAFAIGDNYNDLPMMTAAGNSIAMGNAEPEIKALCDYVTLSNDEDGVAYAIRRWLL